jgi:cell division protein FtsZ
MNTAKSNSYTPSTPQVIETPMVAEPQQAAVASAEPQITNMQNETPETGTIETEYVTEGNAVRKVEVQPEQTPTTSYNNSVIPPHGPRAQEMTHQETSLVLNPPSRPKPQQTQERKTPSLFERITGRHQQPEVQHEQTDTTTSSSTTNQGMMAPSIPERKTVVTSYDVPESKGEQGTLNIDAPSAVKPKTVASGHNADDLDIPAFLRRQIS